MQTDDRRQAQYRVWALLYAAAAYLKRPATVAVCLHTPHRALDGRTPAAPAWLDAGLARAAHAELVTDAAGLRRGADSGVSL